MGYLDNSSITVDAILTKRGRELLSQSHQKNANNNIRFQITQFALGDDEIDYQLFNESHPNGTQYSAEAIENMPLIEALPNGANSMNSKLITLDRGINSIPYIQHSYGTTGLSMIQGATITLTVDTFNLGGYNTAQTEDYIWTILDARLQDSFKGNNPTGGAAPAASDVAEFSTIAHSKSVRGKTLTVTATNNDAYFSTDITQRATSIVVEGTTSSAVATIPIVFKSRTSS